LESAHINNQIDQGIEIFDRATIVHFGAFDAQLFGLAVDGLATGALRVNGVVKQAVAI
jgi:hypothetical protein